MRQKGLNDNKTLFINVTSKCNLNCSYCFYKIESGRYVADSLNKRTIFAFLRNIKEYNFNEVSFTGGEPLLRKDLVECIDFAHNLDFLTSVDTNGTFLDRKRVRKLVKSGINSLFVSLDDLDGSSHNTTRGLHEKTMQGIKYVAETDIEIYISTTVNALNFDKIVNLCKFCDNIGAKIVFHPVFLPSDNPLFDQLSLQRLRQNQLNVLKDQLLYYAKKFDMDDYVELFLSCVTGSNKKPTRCSQGEKSLVIDSNGSVYPCFHRRDLVLGNVLTTDSTGIFSKLLVVRKEIENADCFGEHCVSLFCPFNM